MKLIESGIVESDVFYLAPGKQLTLQASGLQGSDKVVVEVVQFSASFKPDCDCACCPPPVSLPEIVAATPLMVPCNCTPVAAELTAAMPYLLLKDVVGLPLRARVVADEDSTIQVIKTESNLR